VVYGGVLVVLLGAIVLGVETPGLTWLVVVGAVLFEMTAALWLLGDRVARRAPARAPAHDGGAPVAARTA
jgi:hypothetical protein